MKTGEIFTLHKGGKKRTDNPNNYRAITMSSVILKLYEVVLLHRCQDTIMKSLSKQQRGFQKQLGCQMSTFVQRETLNYAREKSATVCVCCLDGRQAFIHVWHAGLFYKLIELNVECTTLLAFRAMYQNACCHIKYNGLRSENFPVHQETKQGGRSSPLLYLAFIDELIKEL